MKRILIFSTAYIPFIGGAEIAVKEITDRIQNTEFDLITARLDAKLSKFEKIGPINVYRIGVGMGLLDKLLLPFLGAYKAWTLNTAKNYDAFWCIMATYASGAAYIVNILRWTTGKKSIPIVLTLQEGDSESHLKYRWAGLIDLSWRLALRRTKVLTAISQYLIDRARTLGFKGEAVLIPNGVDALHFDHIYADEELNDLKKKLNKKLGDIFLVTASRLVEKNAVEDVISALPKLPQNVKFIILGQGKQELALRRLATDLRVETRVQFLGHVEHTDMPKFLKVSDIFIRPSLSEGMGNSFIEAMAAGLPVIATPVGGIVDFLYDPEKSPGVPPTGVFVEVKSPESIAEKVKLLMSDLALQHSLVQNAHKLVREKYEWDLVASNMNKLVFQKVFKSTT